MGAQWLPHNLVSDLQRKAEQIGVCAQFKSGTRQERLASLQAGKPQEPSSRTRGAAIQMSPSEALSLYICPEVLALSRQTDLSLRICPEGPLLCLSLIED